MVFEWHQKSQLWANSFLERHARTPTHTYCGWGTILINDVVSGPIYTCQPVADGCSGAVRVHVCASLPMVSVTGKGVLIETVVAHLPGMVQAAGKQGCRICEMVKSAIHNRRPCSSDHTGDCPIFQLLYYSYNNVYHLEQRVEGNLRVPNWEIARVFETQNSQTNADDS